ncbi:MAG: DUF4177 domain-containing protein [Planctomycetota bacterium]
MKSFLSLIIACLLISFVWSTAIESAPAQPSVSFQEETKQWEYKVIRPRTENGFIRENQLESELNKWGKEGWEYADSISDVRAERTYVKVVLKRMKQ